MSVKSSYNSLLNQYLKPGSVVATQDRFKFVVAGPDHIDQIVNFLGEYHYPQVVTLQNFVTDFKSFAESLRNDTLLQLQDGMSFIIEDNLTGDLVGLAISHWMHQNLEKYFLKLADSYSDHGSFHHWRLLAALYRDMDLFKLYDTTTILHGRVYSLKPAVQNIGLKKTFGIIAGLSGLPWFSDESLKGVVICCEANGKFSNKLMDTVGYAVMNKVQYHDFEVDGIYPFKDIASTTPHTFATLRVLKTKSKL